MPSNGSDGQTWISPKRRSPITMGSMPSDYTGTVQQLMFNRILSAVRVMAIDGVTITRFDADTGTLEGNLAGVNFVVKINTEPPVVAPDLD